MEKGTKALWEQINKYYIPLILNGINKEDYDRQMMYDVATRHYCEMEGFISGYLFLMPYDPEKYKNHDLAAEISREIHDELWEIYLNRD